jgi:hypothetical protein
VVSRKSNLLSFLYPKATTLLLPTLSNFFHPTATKETGDMSKVIQVTEDFIMFDDGHKLYSDHEQDCCERHYLDLSELSVEDFAGLVFDLSSDKFFERVPDFGIRLIPISGGQPVSIPGYGSNNGYYSQNLTLILSIPATKKTFDITDCQTVYD